MIIIQYDRKSKNPEKTIENVVNILQSIDEKLDNCSQGTNKKKKDYDFRKQINWK